MADIPSRRSTIIAERFAVKDNTFKRAVTDNPRDKIEIEIGDSKQPDFKPQAKISRWDNEVNFSLRAEEHPEAVVRTEGKLIKYVTPDYEVHQYELDPGEIGEDGGLEFEWVLPAKPASNVLIATIQTKELDFFYQPALTQEEIDEGASRPENVEGSYAVYHKTKGGMNRVDGMEYKTGKAFHIYRPKVTDKKGEETWAELNIDEANGVLSVTVPQEFLDKAVYPVIVDPTFGYTSVGSSSSFLARNSSDSAFRSGSYFATTEAGTLDTVSVALAYELTGPETIDVIAFVNDEDSGGTGTHGQVAITTERTDLSISGTTANWYDFNGASESLTYPNTYILNVVADGVDIPTTNADLLFFFDTGISAHHYSEGGATQYDTLKAESPWVITKTTLSPRNYSIYATYESGATNVSVDADVVTLTGSLPAPTVTGKANVAADVVTTTLSAQAPTVTGKANVSADIITLTGSLPEPTISTDNVVNVSTDADLLTTTLAVQAPTVTGEASVTADVVTTTTSLPAPTVSTTWFVSVVPDAMVLASSLPEPTVTDIQNVSTTADVVTLTGSIPAATITGDANIAADVVTLTGSIPAATISAIMHASVSADVITSSLSIPEPTLAVEGGYSGNASWGIDINTFGLVMNKKARIPTWTTSTRPTGKKGLFGFNRETNAIEVYNTTTDEWAEFNANPKITVSSSEPASPATGDLWVDTS